jgi:hypothetical protein
MATELCAGQPGFESRQEQWFVSFAFCPHRLQDPPTALSGDTFVRGDMSKSWKLRRTFTQWVCICYAGTDSLTKRYQHHTSVLYFGDSFWFVKDTFLLLYWRVIVGVDRVLVLFLLLNQLYNPGLVSAYSTVFFYWLRGCNVRRRAYILLVKR